jgi:predicted HicB family RNase H-like nuclease
MNPQKMYSDTNITIRVNKEVKRAIKQEAARRGVSLTAYLVFLATAAIDNISLITQPQQ